jgi:hypothetical protein
MEGKEKGKGGGTGQRRTTQLGSHCRFSGNSRQKRYIEVSHPAPCYEVR